MEATLTWMALMARKDKGCMAVRREVAAAGDPLEAWRQWEKRHPIEACAALASAGQQMEKVLAAGAEVVTCQDVRFPPMLANIVDAPPVVYSRGQWPVEWGRAMSVVGTRACTRQGAEWAMQAGREWTGAGGLLVSGWPAASMDGPITAPFKAAMAGIKWPSCLAVWTACTRGCTSRWPRTSWTGVASW